jgi:hypothetical protein
MRLTDCSNSLALKSVFASIVSHASRGMGIMLRLTRRARLRRKNRIGHGLHLPAFALPRQFCFNLRDEFLRPTQ